MLVFAPQSSFSCDYKSGLRYHSGVKSCVINMILNWWANDPINDLLVSWQGHPCESCTSFSPLRIGSRRRSSWRQPCPGGPNVDLAPLWGPCTSHWSHGTVGKAAPSTCGYHSNWGMSGVLRAFMLPVGDNGDLLTTVLLLNTALTQPVASPTSRGSGHGWRPIRFHNASP